MSLQSGTVVTLQVQKEAPPYGYFLTDHHREVLLPYSEANGPYAEGDAVEVFLFHDSEDRLAATTKKPLITWGQLALLDVADFHPRLGCFLEMGLGRNLLMPLKELPDLGELRPQIGDKVYVTLDRDKQGRLLAKWAGERELAPLTFHAPQSWHNQTVECRVYKPLQQGTYVICSGGVLGFGAMGMIHAAERTRLLRLGEAVEARVTHVREDGRVNLSMKPIKEIGREQDAERLLHYLRERPGGSMPYTDETPADIIMTKFDMSKSAFKRALGKLLKEGLVEQNASWTRLKGRPEDKE